MQKEEIKFSNSLIFEGMTSIRSIIKGNQIGNNNRKITKILYDIEKFEKIKKEIGYLNAISKEFGFEIISSNAAKLNELTLGNSHGGIIAFCTERKIATLSEETSLSENGFYVMIQGIEDPYNFGYSIRSLYAMGVSGIVLSPRNWMNAAGVVCRSSAGASEMVDMFVTENEINAINVFKKRRFKVVCADERTENELGNCPLPCPMLLIIGGEKRGISRSILDLCDMRVKIPYGRQFNSSLSAASAATMFAYEILRLNPDIKNNSKKLL